MTDWTATRARKASQLRIALERDVELDERTTTGFDQLSFVPNALPEIDFDAIDTRTTMLGRCLNAPLLISSMTGGTGQAGELNRVLAEVAQRLRIAIGLGSARVLIENPRLLSTFDVRRYAPDVLLFANLGAVQLNHGIDVDACRRLVDDLAADALILHLNPIQEALEPDGDTDFGGLLAKIARLAATLRFPIVVKEVGFGLAPDVVRRLLDAGVAAVDVAGAGGTAWTRIEGERAREPWRAELANDFSGWGWPTATAIAAARQAAPGGLIFGSGGVRTGLDIAKAVALGADLVGVARPFLRVAAAGPDATDGYARRLIEGLRIAMFGVGASSITQLRRTTRLGRWSPLQQVRQP
jgi:isopentenyl-diphosphate Delta-isomerase